jgi:hypothetical protein
MGRGRAILIAVTLALLASLLHAAPASAQCCETASGCYDGPCLDLSPGTFHPGSTCSYATDPPHCTGVTTTTTTLPPGYDDGRLNPDPGEYYAVYCRADQVEIFRAVPQSERVKSVPIASLLQQDAACQDVGDLMTICRAFDIVTVYGSNGNDAPTPGSKFFSLSDCITRNGGLPPPDDSTDLGEKDPLDYQGTSLCSDLEFFNLFQEECLREAGFTELGICFCWLFLYFDPLATPPFAPAVVAPASALASTPGGLNLVQLYRLRDRVLESTTGGQRATQLYYQYSAELVAAALRNVDVMTTGRAALVAWMPIIDALVAGTGDAASVSAEQIAAAEAFLAAVRAAGSDDLRSALEREALLVDFSSFEGLTATQLIDRLGQMSCQAAPTLASLRCRLADLKRLARAQVAGRRGRRLAARVGKVETQVARAEAAVGKSNTRRAKQRLRRVKGLLRGIQKAVGPKKLKKSSDAVRLVLGDLVSGLRTDADALARDPSSAPVGRE